MKRYLSFLIAYILLMTIHEGLHIVTAKYYGEFESLQFKVIIFPEVKYKTTTEERSGFRWALISGMSNWATLALGYWLLLIRNKFIHLSSQLLKALFFYLALLALLMDALNLSIGPWIYGGDIEGIAMGLGANRYLIQTIFLLVLLINRELIIHKLFPAFNIKTNHILFRPIIKRSIFR